MYQSAHMISLESKRQLVAFSELYVELGILEKLLRVAIRKKTVCSKSRPKRYSALQHLTDKKS
jgi:hypothetical protein